MKKNSIAGSALAFSLLFSIHACDSRIEEVVPQQQATSTQAIIMQQQPEFLEGRYIVVLNPDRVQPGRDVLESFGQLQVKATQVGLDILKANGIPEQALYSAYGHALAGFAAELSPLQVARLLADPRVAAIEPDQLVWLVQPFARKTATAAPAAVAQSTPVGISRVGGGTETYADKTDGPYFGKRAYVIDTGIFLGHPDLHVETDRKRMYNAFCDQISSNSAPTTCPEATNYPNDGHGHGTHVAGTIGALMNNNEGVVGVAPGVRVVPVKVLGSNGSGTLSDVLEGLDFVHFDAAPDDVANMSLGALGSRVLDNAIKKVAEKGVLFAIAAGNDMLPANLYSPARVNHDNVFTVAAMETSRAADGSWSDSWASFSNHGEPPIDFIAPGVDVLSTFVKSENGQFVPTYHKLSGTSMAAPHVAGLLILNGNDIKTNGVVWHLILEDYEVAHRIGPPSRPSASGIGFLGRL